MIFKKFNYQKKNKKNNNKTFHHKTNYFLEKQSILLYYCRIYWKFSFDYSFIYNYVYIVNIAEHVMNDRYVFLSWN